MFKIKISVLKNQYYYEQFKTKNSSVGNIVLYNSPNSNQRIKEGSIKPVWAEDSWLIRKYKYSSEEIKKARE